MTARKGFYAEVRQLRTDIDAAVGGEVVEQTKVHAWLKTALLARGTLAIDTVPEKFQTTSTAIWRTGGIQYSKVAEAAIAFTAAHPVTASKFGIILVQVDNDGVVTTKIPGATQTTTQAYNTAPLALAALPAVDSGNTALGYIAIAAGAGGWTAITSDLTTATFNDAALTTVPASL